MVWGKPGLIQTPQAWCALAKSEWQTQIIGLCIARLLSGNNSILCLVYSVVGLVVPQLLHGVLHHPLDYIKLLSTRLPLKSHLGGLNLPAEQRLQYA